MTGIDPTTCKPGEYYLVQRRDYTAPAMRVDYSTLDNLVDFRWVIAGLNGNFTDAAVTVLHRLVPESDDVVDAEVEEDWTILRKAADAILHSGYDPTTLTTVLDVADYLTGQAGRIEADHRAAQQEVAREVLIEKAARIQCDGFYGPGAFDDRAPDDEVRKRYIDDCARLADAGLLAEPGEAS
ncbi:hypothetical protein GMA1_43 [Gordonia phage GMA1]|uniref:hypothetical protein n=1 Tax=Gordonia phage GMA1 TaxID=1647470 RepID=UPI0007B63EA4|nr:hypothetical protein BH788_gp43 [Gordonia phage GMA1]AKJ72140.1 hypothetical protein GMA1_43 [Gordonia phage GMA1]